MGTIKDLKFWSYKVLPLAYDDSLSYYEVVDKVANKLNEVIGIANELPENISAEIKKQLAGGGDIFDNLFNGLINAIATKEGDSVTFTPNEKQGGEIIFLGDTLYEVVAPMKAGVNYIVGTNIVPVDIDGELNKIKGYISANNEYFHERAVANHDTQTYLFWKDKLYRVDEDIKVNDILAERVTENDVTTGQLTLVNVMDEVTAHYIEMHESDNNLQTQIDGNDGDIENLQNKDKDLQNQISSNDTRVNSRIDNIVSQAGNDNTEIVDARLGAESTGGNTYNSLGTAIRSQINETFWNGLVSNSIRYGTSTGEEANASSWGDLAADRISLVWANSAKNWNDADEGIKNFLNKQSGYFTFIPFSSEYVKNPTKEKTLSETDYSVNCLLLSPFDMTAAVYRNNTLSQLFLDSSEYSLALKANNIDLFETDISEFKNISSTKISIIKRDNIEACQDISDDVKEWIGNIGYVIFVPFSSQYYQPRLNDIMIGQVNYEVQGLLYKPTGEFTGVHYRDNSLQFSACYTPALQQDNKYYGNASGENYNASSWGELPANRIVLLWNKTAKNWSDADDGVKAFIEEEENAYTVILPVLPYLSKRYVGNVNYSTGSNEGKVGCLLIGKDNFIVSQYHNGKMEYNWYYDNYSNLNLSANPVNLFSTNITEFKNASATKISIIKKDNITNCEDVTDELKNWVDNVGWFMFVPFCGNYFNNRTKDVTIGDAIATGFGNVFGLIYKPSGEFIGVKYSDKLEINEVGFSNYDRFDRHYTELYAIQRIGCIGDSTMNGVSDLYPSGTNQNLTYSWVTVLKKHYGMLIDNYSISGTSASSWINSEHGYARFKSLGVKAQLFLIGIGINNYEETGGVGDISKIDTENKDNCDTTTFAGAYGKILLSMHEDCPNARFILFTIATYPTNAKNEIIRQIAEMDAFKDYVMVCDLAKNYQEFYGDWANRFTITTVHPIQIGYAAMADLIFHAVSKTIYENYKKFYNLNTIEYTPESTPAVLPYGYN